MKKKKTKPLDLAPDSEVYQEIMRDMMDLSDADLETICCISGDATCGKTFDQLAFDLGLISVEQRDGILGSYLKRRVAEMRKMLLGTQLGSYHIFEEIGRGGMGIVFKARQESPMFTRDVAVKFMLAGQEAKSEDKQHFVSEVKGLAGLNHPFLVSIFDSGIEGDLYYFTMEYVDGWPLSEWPADQEFSVQRKVEIVRDIALALTYLHENGVIHRDIKPGNIMVDRHGATKLLDFGIAQLSTDARRRVVQAGTPHYMAPEVVEPKGSFGSIGPATDIYALGAVLYRLLTGREVFEGHDVGEVFQMTLRQPPSFPSTRRSRLHPELERIVARCLQKRVDERYPTAKELADDLDRFVRRRQFRSPVLLGTGSFLVAGLLLVLLGTGERPPPSRAAPVSFNLAEYEVRVEEVEAEAPGAGASLRRRLEELEAAVTTGGRLSGHLTRFDSEVDAFWKGRIKEMKEKAKDAKTAAGGLALEMPPGEGQRAWELLREGSKIEDAATLLRPGKVAHDRLRLATEKFEEAAEEATKVRENVAKRRERAETETALNSVDEERESLWKAQRLEYSEEAKGLYAQAEAKLAEAHEFFNSEKYPQAKELSRQASGALGKARKLANAAFWDKHDRLGYRLSDAQIRLKESMPSFRDNLPPQRIADLEQALASARSKLEDREERLEDSSRALDKFDADLEAGKENVRLVRQGANGARDSARDLLPTGKAPRLLKKLYGRALELMRKGSAELEGGKYLEAGKTFGEARALLDQLRLATERLTRGMDWVEGGTLGAKVVTGFWVDATEVSVQEYHRFLDGVREEGHARCCGGEGSRNHEPACWEDQLSHLEWPVVGVSFEDANAFARWRYKSIPTRSQWQVAAQAGDATAAEGGGFVNKRGPEDGYPALAPVDQPRTGGSGRFHFLGNAAEWAKSESSAGSALLMGGSYLTGPAQFLRPEHGSPLEETTLRSIQLTAGFRCVVEAFDVEAER